MTQASARPPGLQAERTTLAWTRTSFAFLVNGALLTLRDLHGVRDATTLTVAGVALVAALCTYVIAMQRQRTLQQRPLPTRITPRRQVSIVGVATLLLIVMTAIAQLG
ncbi:hypothetical protein A5647_22685 [Mycobacterium sp. 1100029.7]|nr:hypothetical protein A5647_22685 [Mycobacterium sp. 1100029.7]